MKNEEAWIGPHILSVLPFVDEMVFFDGNSTDATLRIITKIARTHKDGHKISLFENHDPKDLKDDYVRMFNNCMWSLRTDWAWFLHPDMFVVDAAPLAQALKTNAPAMSTRLESYAGEPGGPILHISEGRGNLWKNIYRLRNPDLGAHYHGWYGAADEDVYFSEITGDEHQHFESFMDMYPYVVHDSGVSVMHFSDVRPYERRYGRMMKCLEHQGFNREQAERIASTHPRVTLKDSKGFKFQPLASTDWAREYQRFCEYRERFADEIGQTVEA